MLNKNKIESTIKIGTFFSGIGSPEKALQKLKDNGYINDYKVEFFSEIKKDAIKSYCTIHNISEELNLGDIAKIKGSMLPYCDLWVGGFPCQDISCAGKMKGFNFSESTRSSLGWEMIRLLKEVKVKPKYVIFENVANILSKPFQETLKLFKEDLKDIGYTLYEKILSASDFEIPQTRKRYFLVALIDSKEKFDFPIGIETNLKLKDFLDEVVDEKYYMTDSKYLIQNGNYIFKKRQKKLKIYVEKLSNIKGINFIHNFDKNGIDDYAPIACWILLDNNFFDRNKIILGAINMGIPVGSFNYNTIMKNDYFSQFILNEHDSLSNSQYVRDNSIFLPLYETISEESVKDICKAFKYVLSVYNKNERIFNEKVLDEPIDYFDGFYLMRK